ncbi:TPA: phage tail tape measure protein, partial [Streptococcus suis]|nr:phage tail tape measure protein [Streptococcus suis]
MAKAKDTAGQVGKKLQSVGSNVTDVGKKLTIGVTTPIIGVGTAAVSTAASFEQQMNRVKAISGATGSEFEKLEQQAIELGASSVFSATEVAQAQENMASAGFDAKTIYEAMPGVMALAAVSGGDMALSAEAVATAMNQFGIETSQSSHVADIFAEAAARTNAETSDMAEALKYAGPVAGSFGLTLEETAAAIGIMSNAGIKGSQAGTTLRTSMQRLADPTDEAKAVMEELGLEFFDSSGQMKSLSEITAILQDKMSGLTDEQKSAALSTLFGKESMTGMLSLVDSAPGTIDNLTGSLVNSEGASQKMADTINSGMAGAFENLKGALESAGIAIGKALAPVIEDVTDKITDLVNWFNSLDESTQTTIVTIAGIVAAVGPVLVIIGSVISAIGKIVALFGSGGAIASIVTWITGTLIPAITGIVATVGALPLAIAAIVALIVAYVVTHWDQIKEYLSNFWTWLTELFGNLGEWFGEKWQAVKDKTVEIWDGITQSLSEVWTNITTWFSETWNGIVTTASTIGETLKNVFLFVWEAIKEIFNIAWLAISTPLIAAWNLLVFTAQTIWLGLSTFFGTLWDGIKTVFTTVWQSISDFFTGAWQAFSDYTGITWQGISDFFSGIWDGISSTVQTIWN